MFIVPRFMSHAIAFNLVSETEISEAEPGLILLLLLPRLILSHFFKSKSEDCDCTLCDIGGLISQLKLRGILQCVWGRAELGQTMLFLYTYLWLIPL